MADRDSQRQAELRGSLLTHARLKESRDPDGWVSGSLLATAARDRDRMATDESEASRFLDELVELGLLHERKKTERGIGPADLRHRYFAITSKGRDLCWGVIATIPGVEV